MVCRQKLLARELLTQTKVAGRKTKVSIAIILSEELSLRVDSAIRVESRAIVMLVCESRCVMRLYIYTMSKA